MSTSNPGIVRARILRKAATPEERVFWQVLRRVFPGAKFRRQVPFGRYFADFASHGAKLIVELDGAQHVGAHDYDDERTQFLNGEGYRVLRFWNRDIADNLDGVVRAIEAALKGSPSPLVGEGGPEDRMRGARRSRAPASGRHPSPPALSHTGFPRKYYFRGVPPGRGSAGQIEDLEMI